MAVRTNTSTPLTPGTQKVVATLGFQATGMQFEIPGQCTGWTDFTHQNCYRLTDGMFFTDRVLSVESGGTEIYNGSNPTCSAAGQVKVDLTFTTPQQFRYFAIP